MTIRSTDMQVLIQKVGDVARIQHVQQQEQNTKQQEFINQINQQTARNTNTANKLVESEPAYIYDKNQDEKKRKKDKKKKENAEKEENTTKLAEEKGFLLDIKV